MNAQTVVRLCLLMAVIDVSTVSTAERWPQTRAASVFQSSAPSPSGAVTGLVVDAKSGEALPDALVYLGREGRGTVGRRSRQRTDTLGRFAFTNLPAFDGYSISATAPGYFDGGYSTERAAGSRAIRLNLSDGQWIADVRVPMWQPAVISGTVIDESGEPIVNALVRAIAEVRVAGTTHLANGPVARTDDRGMYRMPGLAPGRYRLSVPSVQASVPASSLPSLTGPTQRALVVDSRARLVLGLGAVPPPPEAGIMQTYPMSFYGGGTPADAGVVEVDYGDERMGIDIQLAPTTSVRVSGTVEGPAEVRGSLLVRLVTRGLDELGEGSEAATTHTAPDGTFVFLSVPAGEYVVDASTLAGAYEWNAPFDMGLIGSPDGFVGSGGGWIRDSVTAGPPGLTFTTRTYANADHQYVGNVTVTVGPTDVSDVAVPLTRAASISGRLAVDPDPARPPTPEFLSVRAEPADGRPALGRPQNQQRPDDDAHEFVIGGLLRGAYLLRGQAPTGWIVKSITYAGHDYTSTPFDGSSGADFIGVVVTFTNRVPVLTGTVHDESGRAAPDAAVIAFPVERSEWQDYGLNPVRIQATDVSPDGNYRLTTLPAGAYYLVAVPSSEAGAWQESDFFSRMAPAALRVEIGWGDRRTVDLKVLR